MFSLKVNTHLEFAEEFVTANVALIFSFLVMHCSCVNLDCVIRLEYLFTQCALHKFKNIFVRELDVPLQHIQCLESQVAILAVKFSLAIMHLDVTLQTLFADENLRTLFTFECQFRLQFHVQPQLSIREEHFSTIRTINI